jgi:flavin reductase (DIM6/NTAB) family NADH-FMN oxidoreductase RutF
MKKSLGAKCIVYPTPVFIVATYDAGGKPNAMAASWGGICCSQPAAVGVSLRKATYTYSAIIERKAFTVNIACEKYAKEADYFGIATGADEDKFAKTGLTPVKSDIVDAPYIEEFPLSLECRVIHVIEIGLHTQFIGEIMDVKADEDILDERGMPLIKKVRPITCSPTDREYFGMGESVGKAWSIGKEIK